MFIFRAAEPKENTSTHRAHSSTRITGLRCVPQQAPQLSHVEAVRRYLASIEAVARYGRMSADPGEAIATLRMLAMPSRGLKELAGVDA